MEIDDTSFCCVKNVGFWFCFYRFRLVASLRRHTAWLKLLQHLINVQKKLFLIERRSTRYNRLILYSRKLHNTCIEYSIVLFDVFIETFIFSSFFLVLFLQYFIILGALFISQCRKSFRSCNKLNAYNRRQINIRINLVSTYHVPNHYMVSNRIENRQYLSVRCKEILLQK